MRILKAYSDPAPNLSFITHDACGFFNVSSRFYYPPGQFSSTQSSWSPSPLIAGSSLWVPAYPSSPVHTTHPYPLLSSYTSLLSAPGDPLLPTTPQPVLMPFGEKQPSLLFTQITPHPGVSAHATLPQRNSCSHHVRLASFDVCSPKALFCLQVLLLSLRLCLAVAYLMKALFLY